MFSSRHTWLIEGHATRSSSNRGRRKLLRSTLAITSMITHWFRSSASRRALNVGWQLEPGRLVLLPHEPKQNVALLNQQANTLHRDILSSWRSVYNITSGQQLFPPVNCKHLALIHPDHIAAWWRGIPGSHPVCEVYSAYNLSALSSYERSVPFWISNGVDTTGSTAICAVQAGPRTTNRGSGATTLLAAFICDSNTGKSLAKL
ncbi:hypothetical protein Pelo_7890 [Pelomyxa schiedti]|nr:hypothetical protein Pelo_7890 [Pelomyxa schiedti]